MYSLHTITNDSHDTSLSVLTCFLFVVFVFTIYIYLISTLACVHAYRRHYDIFPLSPGLKRARKEKHDMIVDPGRKSMEFFVF